MESNELLAAIEREEKNINTDSYSMSIREIISMFKENQINLEPVYQRVYRWDEKEASRLIESLLLGIPVPPIFVAVRDGKWDVVDGVQRLSTLLWFYGLTEKTNKSSPLKLQGLDKLEEFNQLTIEDFPYNIKFQYLDLVRINIVLLKSKSIEAEYQIFNRLNSGGISLSSQEIRSFLIVKLNRELFDMLEEFKEEAYFKESISISQNQKQISYDLELLIYTVILFHFQENKNKFKSLEKKHYQSRDRFIDECIAYLLTEIDINVEDIKDNLTIFFKEIHSTFGKNAFKTSPTTKFSPGIFILLISFMNKNKNKKIDIKTIKEGLLKTDKYIENSKRGTNVVKQFMELSKLGISYNGV